ncbi:hypothetical protein HK102_010626, partial [Quaeritorhiza haematococci]
PVLQALQRGPAGPGGLRHRPGLQQGGAGAARRRQDAGRHAGQARHPGAAAAGAAAPAEGAQPHPGARPDLAAPGRGPEGPGAGRAGPAL